MTILLDLTSLDDNFSGIERFALNISKSIITEHDEHTYILLFKNKIHPLFKKVKKNNNIHVKIIKGSNKFFFYQIKLLFVLFIIHADKYVFLAFPEPLLFFSRKITTTIHDLGCWDCPDTMPLFNRYYFKLSYWKSMHFCKSIITVSNFSKNRIIIIGRVKEDVISVVYNGIDEHFSRNEDENIRKKYMLPDKYILTLSTLEPRKNLTLLLDAYEVLLSNSSNLPDLVLAGRKGWKMDDFLSHYKKELLEHIYFTGFVEDSDLPAVYSLAEYFVFPTKYEGFGIPPLEAMACGTLVLSSDAASMQEVLGDAALYFQSNNLDDLVDSIQKHILIRTFNGNRNKGIVQAGKYKWKDQADKLLKHLLK